jgi:class 3 adenylate cyclase/DNA-binding SARP family transcriptional activator/DNA-binding IscR family transcriptional regulator
MDFRILGPLEVLEDGRAIPLGGSKQRALLALLLLNANETLTTDRLIDELWGERPPARAAKTVQVHISRLRKKLVDGVVSDGPVVTRERGYELQLDPERLDAHCFERLVDEGRRELAAGRRERASSALEDAVSLWRGAPLADLAYEPFAQREIARLEELRIDAEELLIETRLVLGQHAEVVGQLETLIGEHPYRERLRGQLMLALYRCERQADALQVYQDARRTLVEQLGIEPGDRLRELERGILAQDPALAAPAPAAGRAAEARHPGAARQSEGPEPSPIAGGVEPPERLAEKVRQVAGSLEGERKQVTVLFADVQGSMELAEGTDPELWRELLDRFLAIVSEAVHRYDGMLNRFTGDGAMALFGAPIAHEDHARRACYSALRLRDALADFGRELQRDHGLDFAVRIGLNSGEVVVGAVGEDLHLEYTAIGHTVGLASRMQTLAQPGKPYLTEQTAGLVSGFFELEDVGELQVKGARKPVHAYALTALGAARTQLEAATARGMSRFVGRGPELGALEGALSRAEASGQIVGVVAEAGIGKSRLCHEFLERCRQRGLHATVGSGVAHGRQVPLLPVIQMLRAYFGIAGHDDASAARAKVIDRLLPLDEAFRDALPVLFDFLGVADPEHPVPEQMAPDARQRTLFAAMRRLVHEGDRGAAGVLVVEDLHWLDAGSEAFLANLVDSLPGARTLLVVTFRPEYQADWMRRSYYQQLSLMPLDRDATARLVDDLVGPDASLDGLSELIGERTGGNPFFVEEVVQSLVDSGLLEGEPGTYRLAHPIEEIEIPASVQALLAARIDRLPAREKSVLQSAAVIGREFTRTVLEPVTDVAAHELAESLEQLTRAELIYERSHLPEPEYAFRHPLTQDVAYRSQLRQRRARTHAAAARALEALHPTELDELAGLISSHWERADEGLHAARWASRAAVWAGQRHSDDAFRHWRRVRALAGELTDTPEAAGIELAACVWILHSGWRIGLSDGEAEATNRRARELAAASGDKLAMVMVRSAFAMARGAAGSLEEAIDSTRAAGRLAEEAGNLEMQVNFSSGIWLHIAGRNREAVAEHDHILEVAGDDLELGRQFVGASAVTGATLFRSVALMELGRLSEAQADLERALRLAHEQQALELVGAAKGAVGSLSYFTGEPGDGVAHALEGLELADRYSSAVSRVTARMQAATAHLAVDEHEFVLQAVDEALDITRETGTGLHWEALLLSQLALARLGLGDPDGALAAAREGVACALKRGARNQELVGRWALGQALLLLERPDDADAELRHAIELAGEDGAVYVPHVLLAQADLAGTQGGDRERLRQLERAHSLFDQHGATGHTRRVAAQIATAPL